MRKRHTPEQVIKKLREAEGELAAGLTIGQVGQTRATQRQEPAARGQEQARVLRMLLLVAQHPRYGYRRVWALLRAEGWRVNRKRVYRLWRRQGLKVPKRQRKKRRLGSSANGC